MSKVKKNVMPPGHWTSRSSTSGRKPDQNVVVYSNRPPKEIKGGAVKVVADLPVKVWVGPSDKPVPDAEWAHWPDSTKYQLTENHITYNGKTFRVFTFPVPQSLADAQYNGTANNLIWPLFHETDATALETPICLSDPSHRFNYNYRYLDRASDLPDRKKADPDADYKGFKAFNALGQRALETLREKNIITKDDICWVHDYQCVTTPADIFTLHIPFPSLSYLKQVKVNDKPLLEYECFKDYIKQIASYPTVTFQRAQGAKNFIEVLAALDPQFAILNQQLVDRDGKSIKDFKIGETAFVRAFGKQIKLLNVQIGVDTPALLKEAQTSTMDHSHYHPVVLETMGIPFTHTQQIDDVDRVPLKSIIGPMLNTEEPHRIILAMHRNDYSKSTMEKLIAARNYLREHPDEKGKTHFLFFLQPTRLTTPGYANYRRGVESFAKSLRKDWGDSITVIPDELDFHDFMGLLRHPNVIGFLGIATKDGHDLTLREAATARADYPIGDDRKAMAIVTTNGTGASDILRGTTERPGAFIVDTHAKPVGEIVDSLKDVFTEIVDLAKDKRKRQTLVARYEVAAEASAEYTPKRYQETVLRAARQPKRAFP